MSAGPSVLVDVGCGCIVALAVVALAAVVAVAVVNGPSRPTVAGLLGRLLPALLMLLLLFGDGVG